MNVTQLQKVDRWLGIPLCFVLTCIRRSLPEPRQNPKPPLRSILFVKLAEQGSTVLAYAAIREAIETVGAENVYFIVFDDNRLILDVMGVLPPDNVLTISFKTLRSMISSAWRSLRRLRGLNVDAALDLEFFSRGSAALTFLSGARRRVGFHPFFGAGPYRGNLMTHRLVYNPHLHTSQTFHSIVQAAKLDASSLPTMNLRPCSPGELPPLFRPDADETSTVQRLLSEELGFCPSLVLLNPNASDLIPLRRWPIDRYVQLARRLLAKYEQLRVAFTGAPSEINVAGSLAAQVGSDRCVSLAGKTTLRQLLVLFTMADVLVTNDSGPAHFAALTPIRVVTLFGPETPALYRACSPNNVALWAGLVCSPCVSAYNNRQSLCTNNVCMQSLFVDRVFAEVCNAYEAQLRERISRSVRE